MTGKKKELWIPTFWKQVLVTSIVAGGAAVILLGRMIYHAPAPDIAVRLSYLGLIVLMVASITLALGPTWRKAQQLATRVWEEERARIDAERRRVDQEVRKLRDRYVQNSKLTNREKTNNVLRHRIEESIAGTERLSSLGFWLLAIGSFLQLAPIF
jgi:hypothetical protein